MHNIKDQASLILRNNIEVRVVNLKQKWIVFEIWNYMKHGSNGIRKSFEQRSRATKRPPFPLEVVILSCESNMQFNLFLCWSVLNKELFLQNSLDKCCCEIYIPAANWKSKQISLKFFLWFL